MIKVGINGLGRIGRSVIRAKYEGNFPDIQIIAANGPAQIEDHAHLLRYDSIHGRFGKNILIQDNNLIIEGDKIQITHERDPSLINWNELGVDIVLECSGKFNSRAEAAKHLSGGAKKIIVSAPCDNADKTIVYGVNNSELTNQDLVISIGSCTTNALAPIAKILNDSVGIAQGFMTTIHSYTNDQNIMDGSHKDIRRARSAAISMVPTSTGAAKAIGLVLPELNGKLSGSAIRVPTPNVSLIDFCFNSIDATSKEEINKIIEEAASNEFKNIIGFAKDKLVSIDFNHTSQSSIFDPFETNVTSDRFCRIVSWYDNEWGFANRMLDMVNLVAKGL
ncbi:MAG: type I glyceraldehyde-3-phosphate dehydrogenase [Alphaproteobacteria bacterium]